MHSPQSGRRAFARRAGRARLPLFNLAARKVILDLLDLQVRVLERRVAQPEAKLEARLDLIRVKVAIVYV